MIHEFRIYRASPGRLGDLLNRFDTVTLKIWERMGIKQAGFWTAVMADPEWQEKKAKTEENGSLIEYFTNSILQPTSFSAVK